MTTQKDEKEGGKARRWTREDAVWGYSALVLIILTAVCTLWMLRGMPTCTWRQVNASWPWEGQGITVTGIDTAWKEAPAGSRLALRAPIYPEATLRAEEIKGQGRLLLRFVDSAGRNVGQPVGINYSNGVLQNGKAEMTVHLERGFPLETEFSMCGDLAHNPQLVSWVPTRSYIQHCIDESEPLWRIYVTNLPAGGGEEELGYCTINANPL